MKHYTKPCPKTSGYTYRVTKLSKYKGEITSISLDNVAGLPKEGYVTVEFPKQLEEMKPNQLYYAEAHYERPWWDKGISIIVALMVIAGSGIIVGTSVSWLISAIL